MQRFTASLVLAITLLAGFVDRIAAAESELFADEPLAESGVIIRGQSPSPRLPPPQLIAQTLTPQPDAYLSSPVVGSSSAVCLPAMDPYVNCPPQTICPWQTSQFGFFGEFLYLKPRNAEVPFAVPQNGILIPGSAPTGPVGVVDPGYKPGFRAGAFFALGSDARLLASYTWFNSTTSQTVDATGTNVINPLVLFPGTFNSGFTAQQATANYGIKYQLIDIDYQVVAECCNQYWWGYSLGARFGQLNQNFGATYPFAPPDGTTTLNTTSNFSGVGPRAGLEGERVLFHNCGLRAYGKSSASFLVGKFKSTYEQTNQFNGVEVNTSLSDSRIVPILDFEIGLAWLSPGQHIRLSGGYMVAAWFNTVTTPGWIQSVQRVDFLPGSNTLTFDGLTARAEVRF